MALRASAIMRINCIDDDRDHNPNGNKGTCNPEVNSTLRYQYNVLYNVHFTILIFLPLSFGQARLDFTISWSSMCKNLNMLWWMTAAYNHRMTLSKINYTKFCSSILVNCPKKFQTVTILIKRGINIGQSPFIFHNSTEKLLSCPCFGQIQWPSLIVTSLIRSPTCSYCRHVFFAQVKHPYIYW